VEAARPVQVARAVVLLRPLALEHGLGATVLKLLPPIRADGIAAVMPDDRGVREAEARAGCLEPPTHIDVIARYPKLRIEAAGRGFKAGVTGTGQPAVLGLDDPAVVPARDGGRRVGGSIVDHDDLVVRVSEPLERLEAITDGARSVVGTHDHRDPRPRERRRE